MGAILSNGEVRLYDRLDDAIAEHHRICGEAGYDDE
jgi:hypothetical protein